MGFQKKTHLNINYLFFTCGKTQAVWLFILPFFDETKHQIMKKVILHSVKTLCLLVTIGLIVTSCEKGVNVKDNETVDASIQQIAKDPEVIEFLMAPSRLSIDRNNNEINKILDDNKLEPNEQLQLAHLLNFVNVEEMNSFFTRQNILAKSIKKKYSNFDQGYTNSHELISAIVNGSFEHLSSKKFILNYVLSPDCEKKLKLCQSNAHINYSIGVLACAGEGAGITAISAGSLGLVGVGYALICGGLKFKELQNNLSLCNLSFAECQKQ